MINKVFFNLRLSSAHYKTLISYKIWTGKQWSEPTDEIKLIKTEIRAQLETTQKKCAYCGLKFKGKADAQIEHIAPKAYYRHPQFTFTLHNLVLACGYCNTLEIKGTKETISIPHKRYRRCEFLLVHPYFDDPNDHYEWTDEDENVIIQVKNNSAKGLFSIEMFKLDSPEMSELRAAQLRLEEIKLRKSIPQSDQQILDQTMNFKDNE